ncbi:predicted protein [Nematostella vectensis]|uniref:Apple domain-containing protein n=1 Tax=Nematostella vectensis TaxID=45351 RepID=A7RQ47_NEMVE|nr:predicted protein [Nematostella vectensis]|eukprot:XP_001638495.1 predicted protein [Nematostella vectensis]
MTVANKSACEVACFVEPKCVSYNFHHETLTCQLSDTSNQTNYDALKDATGWIYRAIEDTCVGNSCPLWTFCHVGYGGITEHRCAICSQRNFVAHFSSSLHLSALKYHTVNLTDAITAAAWIKTMPSDKSRLQTIFHLSPANGHSDGFVVGFTSSVTTAMNGKWSNLVSVDLRDGRWHHVAVTWTIAAGNYKLYVDGAISDEGIYSGQPLMDAYLMVGQEQDSYGGGFDSTQAFLGSTVGANIWSRVLSESEIALLASSWCVLLEGDAVKWVDLYPTDEASQGDIKIECPRKCE